MRRGSRGEPVELITCDLTGLLIPATAEYVLEGEIDPDPPTGPFLLYGGSAVSGAVSHTGIRGRDERRGAKRFHLEEKGAMPL
jgi:hypothetical protein